MEREDADDGGANDEDAEKQADAYQHVKQANKDDLQVMCSNSRLVTQIAQDYKVWVSWDVVL